MGHPETHPAANNAEAYSETPPPPRIPWERFKYIGYIRAYWRTTRMVMTRPSQLEQFLDTPVSEKYARNFRGFAFQLTAFVTMSVHLIAIPASMYVAERSQQVGMSFEYAVLIHLLGSALSLVGLFLATRSLEWFSRPRDFDPVRQTRALLLSCYMCGPLLIVAVVGAIASLATVAIWAGQDDSLVILQVLNLAWGAVFLVWYPTAVRALYFTTGRNVKRTIIAALALPLIWAAQQILLTCIPLSLVVWYNMAWSFL